MRLRRLLASTGLALGLMAAAPAFAPRAQAEVSVFARAGAWQAFGGKSDDGKKLCGMSTSGGGMWFGVKYFKNDDGFTVQLSNTEWKLKDGVKVKVTMRFDRASPWSAVSTGFHMNDGDAALEFEVPVNKLRQWLTEFRAANVLQVGFPDDNVEDWKVDLRGTTAVSNYMVACMEAL
jgi:hypothetical protein